MRIPAAVLLLLCSAVLLAQTQHEDDEDTLEQIDQTRRKVMTQGKVCPDPARPCPDFKPNELSFVIGHKFNFDRAEDRSLPFYAAILRSDKLCAITEGERAKVQALFPGRKVFVNRYFCQDFGDKVTYSNTNRKLGFIAVYAGETRAEARRFLAELKAAKQYPDANLRRMQVVVTYQLE
jgi:hypothetical protein